MAVYKRGKIWWYKFTWHGEPIRETTKQTNKRVAEQMEAAHKTSLAKGEVGIREKKQVPTLRAFAETDFLPFVEATFAAKVKTAAYYKNGVQNLLAFESLATQRMDGINTERISGYVAKRQADGLKVASINRELQVLRRMFALAVEWGKVGTALPRVRMLAGEAHRERVLTPEEESRYLSNATPLLRDVATVLLDCALRPEECFRLKWANIRDGIVEVHFGKTDNARRRLPVTPRVLAMLEMRRGTSEAEWVRPPRKAATLNRPR